MSALHISKHAVKHAARPGDHSYFPPMSVTAEEPSDAPSTAGPASTAPTSVPSVNSRLLHVLVAEDDPVNSKIVEKRLTKLGHTVVLTGNGEACAGKFESDSKVFDVVLMDIQVRSNKPRPTRTFD